MKHYMTASSWWKSATAQLKNYPQWVVEFGLAAVIAFIFGFIVKNFGRQIVYVFVVLLVAGYILNYFSLATFHILHMKQMFGLSHYSSVNEFVSVLFDFIRSNVPLSVGATIGFLFGWKFGS